MIRRELRGAFSTCRTDLHEILHISNRHVIAFHQRIQPLDGVLKEDSIPDLQLLISYGVELGIVITTLR
jgi:hypothetical protein